MEKQFEKKAKKHAIMTYDARGVRKGREKNVDKILNHEINTIHTYTHSHIIYTASVTQTPTLQPIHV